MDMIRSKKRVADHGEVFTPPWLVDDMLGLVEDEASRIDSRFLEPACGSGNFLVPVLKRKIEIVEAEYGRYKHDERQCYGLWGLMCVYGIELLEDNVIECRNKLMNTFVECLNLDEFKDMYFAALFVVSCNIIHGDALKMRRYNGMPIIFAEWTYNRDGEFGRRDFNLTELVNRPQNGGQGDLFNDSSITMPQSAITVKDLAKCGKAIGKDA